MPAVALESVGRHRRAGVVRAAELVDAAAALLAQGMRLALVSGHDDGGKLRVVYLFTSGPPDTRVELHLFVDPAQPTVPTVSGLSFPAGRFERELQDLFGIVPVGHPQPRRLVLHQHWPAGWHPMRRGSGDPPPMVSDAGAYPFVPVEGTGVYEIPVGPVHAGLIEPGHFRFWVVGETILRMKARLWFVHKGIERLFEGRDPDAGVQLAERISGDTAVGHTLAYCQAVEDAWRVEAPAEAIVLRGLLLELERLYNHVADIGALCNDVGFGVAQAWALSLREDLLQLNARVTGHRLLRGGVVLGGARVHSLPSNEELGEIGRRFDELIDLVTSSALVMERFAGTAVLDGEQARELGVVGVAGRASGLVFDARQAHPAVTTSESFSPALRTAGDVKARFDVRVEEARASLSLLADFIHRARSLEAVAVPPRARSSQPANGVGLIEAWRGAAVHRVELDNEGRLTRVKVVDPSFHNWPALPVSLANTIVPDFPLANKSFNLSYAGNDL
jgi:Ni,Fe-hydrogenase III large subunit/Ni,Fe-hydrogenase III component G